MTSLLIEGLNEDNISIFSELAAKLGAKSVIVDESNNDEAAKLYKSKIQLVRSEKCYFSKDDRYYFIFALYPPTYHYYSHTISKYQGGWYDKKLMTLIAIDDIGNFYYRYPDGSIRYYQHAKQEEATIAKSEKEFLKGIMSISDNYFRE